MEIGVRRRRVQWVWIAALVLSCLTSAVPAAAKKDNSKSPGPQRAFAGRLDPSFGKGGKALVAFPAAPNSDVGVKYDLPFQFTAGGLKMVASPGGKTVVAGSTRIARLLASGKADRQFGNGGVTAIPSLPGRTFVLAAAAVDSRAGSWSPVRPGRCRPRIDSGPAAQLGGGDAIPRRWLPRHQLRRPGVLITDFGVKAPEIGSGRYLGPAVGLRSIVVDSQDRPLLTGGFVAKITYCGGPNVAVSTAFVARLTETGNQDPSFGDNGLRQVADFASFEQGSLLSGSLIAVGTAKPKCEGGGPPVVLTGFNAGGSLNPGFGFAGFRTVGYQSAPVMAIAPSGKILLLGARREEDADDHAPAAQRHGRPRLRSHRPNHRGAAQARLLRGAGGGRARPPAPRRPHHQTHQAQRPDPLELPARPAQPERERRSLLRRPRRGRDRLRRPQQRLRHSGHARRERPDPGRGRHLTRA